MMRYLWKFMLILLLVLPSAILLAENGGGGGSILIRAEDDIEDDDEDDVLEDVAEDVVEGEDEATVESEDTEEEEEGQMTETDSDKDDEDEDEEKPLKPSPDASTALLFVKPENNIFYAGRRIQLLVGFSNKGDQDFIVDDLSASFRYPQDYSFIIQNFTASRLQRLVEPSRQATFEYAFTPSESFSARPFGLVVLLNYKDAEGNIFQDSIFNETITLAELDEGLDGETFFLYVFLAAVAVLLVVGAQQLLATFGKKRMTKKAKPTIEMGTQQNNKEEVDYDWLPKETLQLNSSPRQSPKQSPRQRRLKRATGSGEE